MRPDRIGWVPSGSSIDHPEAGRTTGRELLAAAATVDDEEARLQARAERLLADRTQQLARRTAATTRQLVTLVMLRTEGERFAIRAAEALEIANMASAAVMPRAHPALLGIVDRRGAVCRVYDLAILCGMRQAAASRTAGHLVVLRAQHGQIGLRVDRAETLIEADLEDISSGADAVHTKVGTYTNGGFTLLNCQTILEIVNLAEAT